MEWLNVGETGKHHPVEFAGASKLDRLAVCLGSCGGMAEGRWQKKMEGLGRAETRGAWSCSLTPQAIVKSYEVAQGC